MGEAWPDLAGRIVEGVHRLPVRVYYEDTDFSGIVYHANYLRYCERGRSDFLRLLGIGHRELHQGAQPSDRLGFAVKGMAIDFVKPARIDDVLEVHTRLAGLGRARLHLEQEVVCDGETIFTAKLTAVLLDGTGRPRRLTAEITNAFEGLVPRPT